MKCAVNTWTLGQNVDKAFKLYPPKIEISIVYYDIDSNYP